MTIVQQTAGPSCTTIAREIAEQLGEKELKPYLAIRRAVITLGLEETMHILNEVLELEKQDGMQTLDGSRRRTAGGTFFRLVKQRCTVEQRRQIFFGCFTAGGSGAQKRQPAPMLWDDRIAAVEKIGTQKGKASTVKITLVGQMGKYVDKGACVVGVMQHTGEKLPSLPAGVPTPQPVKTNYVVYVGAKQWKSIADAVGDPEYRLVIEGFPQIDAKTGAISVFASGVKKVQTGKPKNSSC